jgi:prepilin signal peptidase PulO-like enzyme (type II secretory pathway)
MNNVLILVGLLGLGLIWGSFINALVWRLHEKRDWVTERSECPHCHHQLASKDLIPVVSFLMLKGKCRYCKKPIPDTPVSELLTPALFILSYVFWPSELTGAGLFLFIAWLIFIIGFVALAIYDLRWYLLPNKMVFPIIGLAAVQVLIMPLVYHYSWHTVLDAALGALTLSGLFYIIFQISGGTWIGGGDVKLAMALGLLAGDPLRSMLLLFFASFIGSVAAIPIIAKNGLKSKIKLPFGPLLIAGLILVQLFGSSVISWYSNLAGF